MVIFWGCDEWKWLCISVMIVGEVMWWGDDTSSDMSGGGG